MSIKNAPLSGLLLVVCWTLACASGAKQAALCVANSPTAETEQERVVDLYLDAIEARDWTRMESFLTADSVYQDFTMTYYEGAKAVDLRGVAAIVGFWRESSDGTDAEVDNVVLTRFTAGPWVVLILRPHVDIDGAFWDVPGTRIAGSFDQVSAIEVVGGKVLRHVDYVDYGELMGHVEAARTSALFQE